MKAAINDCYDALVYVKSHAEELGIRDDQVMIGGGLCAALAMMARDKGDAGLY